MRECRRPRDPLGRHPDDVLSGLEGRYQYPDHGQEPQPRDGDHHRRQEEPPPGRRGAGASGRLDRTSGARSRGRRGRESAHQYSVWPRNRRNWSSENPRMTMKSTQAIADAEPKWKKLWKAVSYRCWTTVRVASPG